MENPNKSIDNLKDEAVSGQNIKGGNGPVLSGPPGGGPMNPGDVILPGDPLQDGVVLPGGPVIVADNPYDPSGNVLPPGAPGGPSGMPGHGPASMDMPDIII